MSFSGPASLSCLIPAWHLPVGKASDGNGRWAPSELANRGQIVCDFLLQDAVSSDLVKLNVALTEAEHLREMTKARILKNGDGVPAARRGLEHPHGSMCSEPGGEYRSCNELKR